MTKQINSINHAAYYSNVLAAWRDSWGVKPTNEQLAAIHNLGPRVGKQAFTIALTLRPAKLGKKGEVLEPAGVTSNQIHEIVDLFDELAGTPNLTGAKHSQNNKRNELIARAVLREVPVPQSGGLKVYACEVTPLGNEYIAKQVATQAALMGKGNTVEPKPAKRPSKPAGKVAVIEATEVAKVTANASAATASPAMTVLSETVTYDAESYVSGQADVPQPE